MDANNQTSSRLALGRDSFAGNPNRKTLVSEHGYNVEVAHTVSLDRQGIHCIQIEARVGRVRQLHTMTVGPDDDAKSLRPTPPTTEQIQTQVDAAKSKLVNEASWRHGVSLSIEGLK